MVQWLRLPTSTVGAQVQFLVPWSGKFHMLQGVAKNKPKRTMVLISASWWIEMHPLSLPLNQQPVKHPQLNRAALPNTLRMLENPYIGISKGRWAGTQRRAGTRTTAQVVPTVPAPANLVEPAASENPVAAEEKAICPGAPAAVVPTDTGQWVSATEEPGSLPSNHRGIHSAGLHPPPFSAAPTNTTVLQMAEVP